MILLTKLNLRNLFSHFIFIINLKINYLFFKFNFVIDLKYQQKNFDEDFQNNFAKFEFMKFYFLLLKLNFNFIKNSLFLFFMKINFNLILIII